MRYSIIEEGIRAVNNKDSLAIAECNMQTKGLVNRNRWKRRVGFKQTYVVSFGFLIGITKIWANIYCVAFFYTPVLKGAH